MTALLIVTEFLETRKESLGATRLQLESIATSVPTVRTIDTVPNVDNALVWLMAFLVIKEESVTMVSHFLYFIFCFMLSFGRSRIQVDRISSRSLYLYHLLMCVVFHLLIFYCSVHGK